MPPRDPSTVQLDFPQLVADLIDQLNLQGTVGLLDFQDSVQPVFLVGNREGAVQFNNNAPLFKSTEIFTDQTASPAANAVLADTGQLAAGDYDIQAFVGWATSSAATAAPIFDFQHRNAANAATVVTIPFPAVISTGIHYALQTSFTYATTIAENERLRFQLLTSNFAGPTATTIMARARTSL